MDISDTVPWTPAQVAALNERQLNGELHPYTCAKRDDHPYCWGDKGILVATISGWICPFCDYKQNWH